MDEAKTAYLKECLEYAMNAELSIQNIEFYEDWQTSDGEGLIVETLPRAIGLLKRYADGMIKVKIDWTRQDDRIGYREEVLLHADISGITCAECESLLISNCRSNLQEGWFRSIYPES